MINCDRTSPNGRTELGESRAGRSETRLGELVELTRSNIYLSKLIELNASDTYSEELKDLDENDN